MYKNILDYLEEDDSDIIRFKDRCLEHIIHVNSLSVAEKDKLRIDYFRTILQAEQLFSEIVEDFDSPIIHLKHTDIPRETFIRRFIGIDEKSQTINAFETFLHYSLNGWPIIKKKEDKQEEQF